METVANTMPISEGELAAMTSDELVAMERTTQNALNMLMEQLPERDRTEYERLITRLATEQTQYIKVDIIGDGERMASALDRAKRAKNDLDTFKSATKLRTKVFAERKPILDVLHGIRTHLYERGYTPDEESGSWVLRAG